MKSLHIITLVIVASLFYSNNKCHAQHQKMNVAITKPKMKATETYTDGNTYLEHIMAEIISESTFLLNYIDRDDLDLINKHRELGFKNLETTQASAQMEGVEYLIESKILNFTEKWDNHCHVVKEEYKDGERTKKRIVSDTCKHSSIFMTFNMELEMISVESGEVVSKRTISPTAWSYEPYNKAPTDEDKQRMRIKAYDDMRPCFNIIWKRNLLKILLPEIPVIDIPKSKKGKAQMIYIAGGKNANFPSGGILEVVKKYDEKIGDELISRQEKIGEVSLEEVFYGYSLCNVKEGKEEIYAAMESGADLYCVPGIMSKIESCGNFSSRKKKMDAIKSTNKTITLEDKAKEAEKVKSKGSRSTTTTSSKTKPKEVQIKAKNPKTGTTKKGGGKDL